jgi:hypothetical protein
MRGSELAVVVLASFVLLAGVACGATAKSKPLAMTARVVRPGEFKGYTPEDPRAFSSPRAYLAGGANMTPAQLTAWIARLTREGFERDVTEFLEGAQGPGTGLSGVMQLGSDASARAELAAELRFYEGRLAQTFRVKTIPGAVGYGFSGSGEGGENVLFADGPFLYLVGYGWIGNARSPRHSALIDAATKLYMRVHGHPAS